MIPFRDNMDLRGPVWGTLAFLLIYFVLALVGDIPHMNAWQVLVGLFGLWLFAPYVERRTGTPLFVVGFLFVAGVTGFLVDQSPRPEPASHPDPDTVGLITVALFAATPMSIVLNMAYTEALFCAVAVWALIGVLEERWLLAGVCALLAGATRPTGVVVIATVVVVGLTTLRRRPGRSESARILTAITLSPIGYLGFLGVVWARTGHPLGWFTIQTDGWDTRFDFGVAAVRFVNDSLTHSGEVAPVATAAIMLSTPLLIAVAVWSRLPWPVLLYAMLVVASIMASSGLMMSRARLLLPAFVLLIPFAVIMARWRPPVIVATLLPVVAGSAWFGAHMLTVYPHAM